MSEARPARCRPSPPANVFANAFANAFAIHKPEGENRLTARPPTDAKPSKSTCDRSAISDRIAVSPREAADLLGVSHMTVYELINSGRLPSVKVGARRLIAVSALRALVESA